MPFQFIIVWPIFCFVENMNNVCYGLILMTKNSTQQSWNDLVTAIHMWHMKAPTLTVLEHSALEHSVIWHFTVFWNPILCYTTLCSIVFCSRAVYYTIECSALKHSAILHTLLEHSKPILTKPVTAPSPNGRHLEVRIFRLFYMNLKTKATCCDRRWHIKENPHCHVPER